MRKCAMTQKMFPKNKCPVGIVPASDSAFDPIYISIDWLNENVFLADARILGSKNKRRKSSYKLGEVLDSRVFIDQNNLAAVKEEVIERTHRLCQKLSIEKHESMERIDGADSV